MPMYLIDLWLDGYDNEEDENKACEEFISESLDFSASSVSFKKIEGIEDVSVEKLAELWNMCKKFADEEKTVCKKTPEDFILKNKLDYNRMCLGAKIEEFFAKK